MVTVAIAVLLETHGLLVAADALPVKVIEDPCPTKLEPVIVGNGFVVTVWVVVTGPLQPAALAVIVVFPDHPAAKVTAPVAELILFPEKPAVVVSKL